MVDTARKIDATNSAPDVRDLTLDVVKGALVVLMVVCHAMNIFSIAGPDEYAYVRFVSGSFILMSCYIVARFDGPRLTQTGAARPVEP
jgi:fucose 4-O-acetylase-like acetyltransferase